MKSIFLVGIGGFVGSIARYGVSTLMSKFFITSFPLGTFVVNIIGSFIIGIIYAMTEEFSELYHYRLLLATGFCGGFTTFSAFSIESLSLIEKGNYGLFMIYSLLSVVLGLVAVFIGITIVEQGHHVLHSIFKMK